MRPSTTQKKGRGVCHLSATDDLPAYPVHEVRHNCPDSDVCARSLPFNLLLIHPPYLHTSTYTHFAVDQHRPSADLSDLSSTVIVSSSALAEHAARWQPQPLPIQSPRPSLLRIPSLPSRNPMPRRRYTTTHNSLVDSISI